MNLSYSLGGKGLDSALNIHMQRAHAMSKSDMYLLAFMCHVPTVSPTGSAGAIGNRTSFRTPSTYRGGDVGFAKGIGSRGCSGSGGDSGSRSGGGSDGDSDGAGGRDVEVRARRVADCHHDCFRWCERNPSVWLTPSQ